MFTALLRSFPIGDNAFAADPLPTLVRLCRIVHCRWATLLPIRRQSNPPEGSYLPLQSDTRNALFHQMLGRRGILGWRQWRALNLQQSSVSCVLRITN